MAMMTEEEADALDELLTRTTPRVTSSVRGIRGAGTLSYPGGKGIFETGENGMYATYHLKAEELNADVVRILKNTYSQQEIVILPKKTYDEWEKERYNAAFTGKLQQGLRDIEESRGIVKTMAELKAMEDA
ncbi:MAG: hypothetical protein LBK74_07895 [Treponema sp.]|jgi:hypothetical protein|nr:hypothetical protein [Treponema sp.]